MPNTRMQTKKKPDAMVRAAKTSQVRNTKRFVEQVNEPAHRTRKARVNAMKAAILRLLSARRHVQPYIRVGQPRSVG